MSGVIFGRPHNHQASDGPDYEGCPACIEHEHVRRLEGAVRDLWGDLPADQVRQLFDGTEDTA